MLAGRRLIVGVTGSIAAYKAISLVRRLTEAGAEVTVVLTAAALRFVTPLTFQTLSRRPVYHDLFDPREEIVHLSLAEQADVMLIAPATANTLSRLARGAADDLLASLVLAARCPVMIAPAMDAVMWEHPLVQRNVEVLRAAGAIIVPPQHGALASGLVGPGRLADEPAILAAVETALHASREWADQHVVVTAGPTREPIDAVRTLTNRSSGKMGFALAEAARSRGARVTLIAGPTELRAPFGVETIPVETAEQMRDAVRDRVAGATLLIMAAAVSDYRPATVSPTKLKRGEGPLAVELIPTPDIVAEAARANPSLFVVGFAAETERLVERASEKLRAKGLDLIVANDVSAPGIGFGSDYNEVTIVDPSGTALALPRLPKRLLAERVLDRVHAVRRAAAASPKS